MKGYFLSLDGESGQWSNATPEEADPWTDFTLEFRLRWGRGQANFGFREGNERYIIELREESSLFRLVRQAPDHQTTLLAQGSKELNPESWHAVRINADGGRLSVYLDREILFEYVDAADPVLQGLISFGAAPNSLIHLDDVQVTVEACTELVWSRVGDPPGGEVTSLAMDPRDPQHLVAGTDSADAFLSTDGGAKWGRLRVGNHITDLAFDSHDSGSTYFIKHDLFRGDGQWQQHQLLLEAEIDRGHSLVSIAVDPVLPGVLWVGADGGVFRSTDRGDTWSKLSNGFPADTLVRPIAVDPSNPQVVYAGTEGRPTLYERVPGGRLPRGYGVFKSTDGGDTWKPVNTGLTNLDIMALATGPSDPLTVYAGTWGGGLFRSVDGGQHWEARNHGLAGEVVHAILLLPDDPKVMYVGTDAGVYRSRDGGGNWQATDFPRSGPEGSALGLLADPQKPEVIYAGTRGGVYKSNDGGLTAGPANDGIVDRNIVKLAADPSNPEVLYAGTDCQSGLFKSTDAGATWEWLAGNHWRWKDLGLPHFQGDEGSHYVMDIAVDPTDNDTVYLSYRSGVDRSRDGGLSWVRLEGEDNPLRNSHVHGLAVHPRDPKTIFAGAGHGSGGEALFNFGRTVLIRSDDGGETWRVVTGFATEVETSIFNIVFDPNDPQVMYITTHAEMFGQPPFGEAAGVFQSTDGGETWHPINNGLHSLDVPAIAIDPRNGTLLYVGTEEGVFRSTDQGATWAPSSEGMPEAEVHAMAIDPLEPDTVYAATHGHGVFKSPDRGEHWYPVNLGLPAGDIRSMIIDARGEAIYAAVLSRGIFRAALHQEEGRR